MRRMMKRIAVLNFVLIMMFGSCLVVKAEESSTDAVILNQYEWDLVGNCGGDKSAKRIDTQIPACYIGDNTFRYDHAACFDNVKWALDIDTGTLFIYGKGPMAEFDGSVTTSNAKSPLPEYCRWVPYKQSSYRDDSDVNARVAEANELGNGPIQAGAIHTTDIIHHVIVGEGVTTIGSGALNNYPYLSDVSLPSTIKEISNYALSNCVSLKSLMVPKETQICKDALTVTDYTNDYTYQIQVILR